MTFFYKTNAPLSQAHNEFFTAAHQTVFAGNRLAVIDNGDGTLWIKCAGEQIGTLPADFTCLEVQSRDAYSAAASAASINVVAGGAGDSAA